MAMESKLGKLQNKYYNSGINGNPVITDEELQSLLSMLKEVCNYMSDRGENSIKICMWMEIESLTRTINAHKR